MLVADKHHDGTAKSHEFSVRQRWSMGKWTVKETLQTLSHTDLVHTAAGPRRASYEAGIRVPTYWTHFK